MATDAFAIVETGGKQYRAAVGQLLDVEKLAVEPGQEVAFDQILLVSDDNGTRVGAPLVEGATVKAEVTEQGRGRKVTVFKMKRRKDYRRKQGHRQAFTRVRITAIEG